MSGGGGGGGGESTTTNSIDQRFSPLIDYATQAAGNVQRAGFTPYTQQRFADVNNTQRAGIGMVQDRALNGDPTVNAGAQSLQNQLNAGQASATVNPYAQQGNPYLDAMVNRAQGNVLGNANAAATRSGSFGNSGIAQSAAREMGGIAENMYGNAYGQQAQLAESGAGRNDQVRQNQTSSNLQAAGQALSYGDQRFKDAGQLMQAGDFLQGQSQQDKDFAFQQFSEKQNLPYKQMAAYSGLLGSSGSTGSSKTTSTGGGK